MTAIAVSTMRCHEDHRWCRGLARPCSHCRCRGAARRPAGAGGRRLPAEARSASSSTAKLDGRTRAPDDADRRRGELLPALQRRRAAAGRGHRPVDRHSGAGATERPRRRRSRRRPAQEEQRRLVRSHELPDAAGCRSRPAASLRHGRRPRRFTLETAAVSGIPMPKSFLQELVSFYTRTPDYPNGISSTIRSICRPRFGASTSAGASHHRAVSASGSSQLALLAPERYV